MTPQGALAAELKALEEELLVPAVCKSTRLTELLADKFIEFGSSGRINTKSDLVAELPAESPVAQTTSDSKVTSLAPDVALLIYNIRRHAEPLVQTLRTSVWRRINGQCRVVFHRGTIARTAKRFRIVVRRGRRGCYGHAVLSLVSSSRTCSASRHSR